MSKYQPLAEHLRGLREPVWRPSFAELEAVLGFPLPKAARGPRWWDRGSKSVSVLCLKAGWAIDHVDPEDGAVKFRRVDRGEWTSKPEGRREAEKGATPRVPWSAVLGGAAMALVGVALVSAGARGAARVSFSGKRRKGRAPRR